MKRKLLYLAFCFVLTWTIGDFTGSSYSENFIYTAWMIIGASIYLGIHKDIKSFIIAKLQRAY